MNEQDFCESCNQKHNCQKVYQRLGKSQGPSVVFKVVIAFLLPLLVFIASLAAFESILAKAMNAKGLATAVSCVSALAVTFIFVVSCSLFVARGEGK